MQSALGFIPFAEPLRALEVVGLKFGLQEQLGAPQAHVIPAQAGIQLLSPTKPAR